MAAQDKKWILRDSSGHIYGPFTISKLSELITKGIVSGDEDVAAYPTGDWRPLSSERELYDVVLEVLAQTKPQKKNLNKVQPTVSKSSTQSRQMRAEKIEKPPPLAKAEITSRKIEPEGKKKEDERELPEAFIAPVPMQTPLFDRSFNQALEPKYPLGPDLELDEKKYLKKKNKGQLIPIFFLLGAAVLFFIALSSNEKITLKSSQISLLSPRPRAHGEYAKSQAMVTQAQPYFNSDTVSNYIRAEELYVRAVEEYPGNSDALAMLLMTDKQLWPYARQDGSDQNALQNILQLLSKADLYGPKRALGAAIVDLTLGRNASAQSQINSSLIAQPGDGRLYDLKAQIFLESSDYQQAVAYYDQVATLMPNWVYPFFMLGYCYSKEGNLNVAQTYYLRALKMNPNHVNSRLELGVIEARYFGHEDRGREYISVALDSGERFVATAEARGRYTLALIYNKLGDRGHSKAEAEKALKLDPGDPDIREFLSRIGVDVGDQETAANDKEHMALGDRYMLAGNFLGAQAQYKAAFAANPKNARAAMHAAEALWKLHDSTDAIRYLQSSIAADPKFVESYVILADYKSQRYDFSAAVTALERALKVDPKNYEIYRGYAELFLRRADPATAEVYANRAFQLYETDVKLNEVMARIQVARRNIIKGMQYAKRAIELDKTNVSAQVNYAKIKAQFEGVRSGAEYIKNLIDTYPDQIAYRIGFAEILVQDEQYGEAKQVLQQVVAADENNKEAYMLLGDINFLNNAPEEALNDFMSAARVDPSDPSGLFRAGEIYLKAGNPSEAQKQFQLVLRVTPLFPRAHYNLAKAYQSLGLGDLAIKELDEEKKLNPKLADPYEFSGDLYMASRNYTMATRDYQKASEIKPQDPGIFVKLARAYRGQGSSDAALAMLRIAQAKESGFAEVYREYGLVYEGKGMGPEAVRNYQQYLNLEPNAADKAEILGKIKELE